MNSTDLVREYNQFAEFYSTFWTILGNLHVAHSTAFHSFGSAKEVDAKFYETVSKIDRLIGETMYVFNDLIHNIAEYKAVSEETFSFLLDDLEIAINASHEISESAKPDNPELDMKIGIFSYKLKEIRDKCDKYLKLRERMTRMLR